MIRGARAAALALVGVLGAVAACHHARPACDDCGGPMQDPASIRDQNQRVKLCNAAATLHAASCAPFATVATAKLDDCTIVDDVFLSGYAECLADTVCESAQACVARVDAGHAAPYDGPTSVCEQPGSRQPYLVEPAELGAAVGAADTKLGDTKSSVEHPIEVCRTPEEIGYLARVTCADGSRPFPDRAAAAAAARTPAGVGGRCGRVIDHIVVPCAEHPYDVYVDAYRCPGRG